MAHPMKNGTPRLLTDRELGNFDRFMKRSPEGAFDAAMRSRFRNGIPLKAFGKGGAFDSANGPTDDILDFCKARGMKDEDLAKLGKMLDQPADPADDDDLPEPAVKKSAKDKAAKDDEMDDPAEDAEWSDEDEAKFKDMYKRRKAAGQPKDDEPKRAMDSRRTSNNSAGFFNRFPDAARIKLL